MANLNTNFKQFTENQDLAVKVYFENQKETDIWTKHPQKEIKVISNEDDIQMSVSSVSEEAINQAEQGLLIMVPGMGYYPLRECAWKGLLDRARISGNSLTRIDSVLLADLLTQCTQIYKNDVRFLIRDEMITAVVSGDETDYKVLPMYDLIVAVEDELNKRFSGFKFERGYTDYTYTSLSWSLPGQRDEIIGDYIKHLLAAGWRKQMTDKIMPGILFQSSDTGVSSVKISTFLQTGANSYIRIGSAISMDHRNKSSIEEFKILLEGMFGKMQDTVEDLNKLLDIKIKYPVSTMQNVCDFLKVPKKPAAEAINMYQVTIGNQPDTAHGIFMAMQEILYNMKINRIPMGKILQIEEDVTRCIKLNWSKYDYPSRKVGA